MIDLNNTNIILTGATGGIGNSILEVLTNAKANILATGTNIEKLNKIKQSFKSVKTLEFNLSAHDKIEEFIEESNKIFDGKIDVLINNAGITRDNLSIRMKEEEWNEVININLTSTFLISKFVIKKMLKNKNGKIINVTSVVGHTGNIGQSNYSSSKAGVIAMSKSLALEYGKKNIKVNCISPGFISTDMTDKINENHKELLMSKIPLERFGKPSDVANIALFLSSNLSDYITGETIHVNGGMYFSKVKKIVADHLGIDEAKVTEESSFIDDLGADSLDTVELVMAFEEEFGSEISDSDAEKILTVGDAVKFIENKAN